MPHRRAGQAALLLVMFFVTAATSTIGLSLAHQHSSVPAGSCDLCKFSHLPVLQSPIQSSPSPALIVEKRAPLMGPRFAVRLFWLEQAGRAPPA